jgi:Recombination endonuclease VII
MAYKHIEDTRRYDREWKQRYRAVNRKKHREYMREYTKRPHVHARILQADRARHRTPESVQYRRTRRLQRLYGLTPERYNQMLAEQNGVCAICSNPPTGEGKTNLYLHVDHNHTTGQLRRLLCKNCNNAIGLLNDSPYLAARLAKYLITIP